MVSQEKDCTTGIFSWKRWIYQWNWNKNKVYCQIIVMEPMTIGMERQCL